MNKHFHNILILLIFLATTLVAEASVEAYQEKIRAAGDDMLENLEVSYVYGGSKIGAVNECDSCNQCLEKNRPAPKLRFKECPTCQRCSLDCSHFVQLVFARAGLEFPYLTSSQMLELSPEVLRRKYNLLPISVAPGGVMAGDLLVYRGHVVIVERTRDLGVADIIHATGGKDIREPGQGIQRERFVRIENFRGPLLRIIRHLKLSQESLPIISTGSAPDGSRHVKLRPVEKRIQN